MVFAEITGDGENAGKYIWANGVEYKVADATNLDELIRRVEDVSQYAINVSSALNDLSTFIRAEVSDLSTHVHTVTDASVTALETWRSNHADPSLNAFDASLINHETRIKNLEDASNSLSERIADVSQNVIDISTYVHQTVDASIVAIHTKDSEQDTSISDISTRLSNVAITSADNSIYVNGTSIAVEGDNYIDFTTADNKASVAMKDSALVKGTGTGASDVSLATKGYVDEQVAVLEQALVFKGGINGTADASTILTDGAVEAGWTYVASADGVYNGKNFEVGDLIIVKTDSAAGAVADVIMVERNLDGAVTADNGLTSNYVILGDGDQKVKVSTLAFSDLEVAIANANSAIQGVNANSSTATFVEVQATTDASIVNISIGAKVITLNDASDGTSDGLASAHDVYVELTAIEEVLAAANNKIADSVGLDENYNPGWSTVSGIDSTKSYREVIEELHGQVAGNVVNTIGGAHGDISLSTSSTTGDVSFGMDSSVLVGKVQGWSELTIKVDNIDASLADLSTNVIPGLNTSINTLEDKVEDISNFIHDSSFVNTITAEGAMTGATSSYIAVKADASKGDVTLSSEVLLATYSMTSGTAATPTGLATDALVKDYVADQIAWAVITD